MPNTQPVAILACILFASLILDAENTRSTPPFRILFNNDLTNVVNCESPYHSIGDPFSTSSLEDSINETCEAGIDLHALSPGHGWEPLWRSESYPYPEHAAWYRERTGMEVSTFGKHMLNGGDVVGEFVDHCRKVNMPAFISFRLNDWHHKNYADLSREQLEEYGITKLTSMETSRFYDQHPEYRLNTIRSLPDPGPYPHQEYIEKYRNEIKANNLQDWSILEVRQHKFTFISEISRNYDIDGLELDFLRHGFYFRPEFPMDDRVKIMTEFVCRVRRLLDNTARPGKPRWLSVRIPSRLDDLKPMGLDVEELRQTGVDMFVLGHGYESEQQNDLATVCSLVPDAAIYLEMTPVVARYPRNDKSGTVFFNRNEDLTFIMTRPEHYFTAAHLAYSRGARGISLFNFAYYRKYGTRPATFAREPFFEIIETLGDPEKVARQPQHYFIGDHDIRHKKFSGVDLSNGFQGTFTLDMAPPAGGWQEDGVLRIQVEPEWGKASCEILFNGRSLEPTDQIEEPYETDLREGSGGQQSLRAWIVPKEILKDGLNSLEIQVVNGIDSKLVLLDLAVR